MSDLFLLALCLLALGFGLGVIIHMVVIKKGESAADRRSMEDVERRKQKANINSR